MTRNIIIGGAQFSSHYGTYVKGNIDNHHTQEMLLKGALDLGYDCLDLGQDYTNAIQNLSHSEIIGNFRIINKFKYDFRKDKIITKLYDSLSKLKQKSYQLLLLHNWSTLTEEERTLALELLLSLKTQHVTSQIGISVYECEELHELTSLQYIDVIQAPLNFYNSQFLQCTYVQTLVNYGKTFHARSIFAQGLLINQTPRINKIFPELSFFNQFCEDNKMDAITGALSIFDSQTIFSSIVIGFNSVDNLIKVSKVPITSDIKFIPPFSDESQFKISDPRKWL